MDFFSLLVLCVCCMIKDWKLKAFYTINSFVVYFEGLNGSKTHTEILNNFGMNAWVFLKLKYQSMSLSHNLQYRKRVFLLYEFMTPEDILWEVFKYSSSPKSHVRFILGRNHLVAPCVRSPLELNYLSHFTLEFTQARNHIGVHHVVRIFVMPRLFMQHSRVHNRENPIAVLWVPNPWIT